MLSSALAALPTLRARVAGRRLALFLDYDGTLTPIVARPEDAVLAADVRAILVRLAARWPVAIVSGRDRAVVEALVAIDGLAYVGSHGLDIVGPPGSGVRREIAVEFLPALDAAETALRERLAGVAGALVERKRFTIAVHWRLVTESDRSAVDAAVAAVHAVHPRLRRETGKAVFELRPDVEWDKGRAVTWLREALALEDALAIYVGDDLTDESAFAAVAGRGLGIFVGDPTRSTRAELVLRDPTEVAAFLDELATFP